jgi:hypothetical protein
MSSPFVRSKHNSPGAHSLSLSHYRVIKGGGGGRDGNCSVRGGGREGGVPLQCTLANWMD